MLGHSLVYFARQNTLVCSPFPSICLNYYKPTQRIAISYQDIPEMSLSALANYPLGHAGHDRNAHPEINFVPLAAAAAAVISVPLVGLSVSTFVMIYSGAITCDTPGVHLTIFYLRRGKGHQTKKTKLFISVSKPWLVSSMSQAMKSRTTRTPS